MIFINTSSVAARQTPLISAAPDYPFVEASPKRLLTPDQQALYRKHALRLVRIY